MPPISSTANSSMVIRLGLESNRCRAEVEAVATSTEAVFIVCAPCPALGGGERAWSAADIAETFHGAAGDAPTREPQARVGTPAAVEGCLLGTRLEHDVERSLG